MTTATTTYTLGLACSCCTLATANADDSGCRFYCGDEHADRLAEFGVEPGETVVVGDEVGTAAFRCVGCGDDTVDLAHEIVVIA